MRAHRAHLVGCRGLLGGNRPTRAAAVAERANSRFHGPNSHTKKRTLVVLLSSTFFSRPWLQRLARSSPTTLTTRDPAHLSLLFKRLPPRPFAFSLHPLNTHRHNNSIHISKPASSHLIRYGPHQAGMLYLFLFYFVPSRLAPRTYLPTYRVASLRYHVAAAMGLFDYRILTRSI